MPFPIRSTLLLLPLGLLLLALPGCGDTNGADADAALLDDAAASAALADGDGEDLSDAFASIDFDAAAEEDVDHELMQDEAFADGCRFVDFRRRVIAEYDADDDGGLDRDERLALRDDFAPRPIRRRAHARFHRVARLAWIYDFDDSGHLDAAERDALRGDLELRCMSREAWLLENYDADGSGDLEDDEWSAALDDLAARLQARREAFIDAFDENGDGHLDFFERVAARIARLERILERHFAALDEYDDDGDGRLSTEERLELRERLQARVRGERFTGDAGDASSEGDPIP